MIIRPESRRTLPSPALPPEIRGLRRLLMSRLVRLSFLALFLAPGASCGRPQQHDVARGGGPRPGVSEIEPGKADLPDAAGQTIYVPAYSAIATADNPQLYQLAITLSVRNTDQDQPILLTDVRYHDQDGRLVRSFLKKPLRIAPPCGDGVLRPGE